MVIWNPEPKKSVKAKYTFLHRHSSLEFLFSLRNKKRSYALKSLEYPSLDWDVTFLLNLFSFPYSVYLFVGADGEKVARFIRKLPATSTVCIHYGLLIYRLVAFLQCAVICAKTTVCISVWQEAYFNFRDESDNFFFNHMFLVENENPDWHYSCKTFQEWIFLPVYGLIYLKLIS